MKKHFKVSGSSFKLNEETDPEVALKLYMSGIRVSEGGFEKL